MTSDRLVLAARLRRARHAARVTQEVLAARLGKPQSFVAKYELGERSLRVPEYLQVMDALGVEPMPILKEVFGDAPPAEDFSFPPRLKIEDFFAMTRALATDPFVLLAKVRVAKRTPRKPLRQIANAWLQGKWPGMKPGPDHPWRKPWPVTARLRPKSCSSG